MEAKKSYILTCHLQAGGAGAGHIIPVQTQSPEKIKGAKGVSFKSKAQEPETLMGWGSVKWMSQLKQESSKFILPLPSCSTQVLNRLDEAFCFSFICKCMSLWPYKIAISGSLLSPIIIKMQLQISGTKKGKENSY